MEPPVVSVLSPDDSIRRPPASAVPLPTETLMLPPAPPEADPVRMTTDPLLPLPAVSA